MILCLSSLDGLFFSCCQKVSQSVEQSAFKLTFLCLVLSTVQRFTICKTVDSSSCSNFVNKSLTSREYGKVNGAVGPSGCKKLNPDYISFLIFFVDASQPPIDIWKQQNRFDRCYTIARTQKLHAFIPQTKNKIKTFLYSLVLVTDWDNGLVLLSEMNCGNFVASKYDDHWWLACVNKKI